MKSAANTVPKIELTIQGTDFGSLLTSLQRWIVPVNALKVSVFKRGEHFSFSLDWPNEDRAFAAKYAVSAFRNDVLEEAKLGASIGCRILWLELAEKSPSIAEIHPDVFCRWAEALSLFESGETARSGGSSDEIVSKRNKQALELLGKLPTTVENFPPLQNLFALLIEASGKPKTEIDHAWNNLSRVMAGEPPEPYLPPQVVATVTVDDSVTGAGRLVAVELPKGAFNRVTAAAVVRDQSNKRFLVLPDYAFNSDAPVGVWVADGLAGTVSQRIGSFYRKLSKHGIALVALEAETSASNRVMNGVLQSIGSVNIGDEVSLLSAVRGNARTAKVATIHLVGNSSRIVTDRQISRPGDGGAPVVDSDGNLVAMGYVGNPKEDLSEFIALQPVFKELGLSLAD